MRRKNFELDWLTILQFSLLVFLGWVTIYTVSSGEQSGAIFDRSLVHGKQIIWIGISAFAALVILILDNRFIEAISYIGYGVTMLLLVAVLFIGKEINGAKSWIIIGSIQIQPAEFAKVATALALAKYMSGLNFSMNNLRQVLTAAGIIIFPALVVILQNDTGSALVFFSFLLVFYREGLNALIPVFLISIGVVSILTLAIGDPWIVVIILAGLIIVSFVIYLIFFYERKNLFLVSGIHISVLVAFSLLSFSTDFLVKQLKEHQYNRIMVLFDPGIDPLGKGYNVIQSKIAIGSGGLKGKGFLEGNYTKYRFVPKQETDFIFCTIGEEWGWLGSSFIIGLFFLLLWRLKFLAENSKTRFARIYGYGAVSILFFHIMVNTGMTIGLVPVIGIPLPFFSYGGSSLLGFTILIMILINQYSYRGSVLGTKY